MQHGLSGNAEGLGGVVESQPAIGDFGPDPVAQSLVDADTPGAPGVICSALMKPSRIHR